MIRRPLSLSSALALAVLLAACGGGGDAPATEGATTTGGTTTSSTTTGGTTAAVDLPCNTALFAPDSVVKPTAAQLAAYAGTYEGSEGQYGPNPGDPFVPSGTAVLVVQADGTVTYKGTAYTPVSVCLDKAAGPVGTLLYVHTDLAHLDIADKADALLGQAWGIALSDPTQLFQGAVKR